MSNTTGKREAAVREKSKRTLERIAHRLHVKGITSELVIGPVMTILIEEVVRELMVDDS